MLIDADGLNLLAENPAALKKRKKPTLITPHTGEAGRLLKRSRKQVESNRKKAARDLQKLTGATVILKGFESIVTDASKIFINSTGNPGMATAGSGDVLSGILLSFLGRGHSAFDTACFGAALHGLAGDLAAEVMGEESLMATDIMDSLPEAIDASREIYGG